ncbi:MAG: hypothetical protein KDD73_10640 [Anaerolineales bacterium]|nr:hypothetical protein [Anaerolineales bacterium]MCB9128467.1 hypothetical protein [Ardenticatenales bacterium]
MLRTIAGRSLNPRLAALLLVAVAALGVVWWQRPSPPDEASASLIAPLDEAPNSVGFARATDPNGMTFPDAFGPHPDYQTEWWYYTGNVATAEGRRFGYQFTIFRRSLRADVAERRSDFATQSLYMAHFALTDVENAAFYADERFQRDGGGAAGATATPYAAWLDDWQVREVGEDRYQMSAATDEVTIDFTLEATKAPVRHGDNGLSPKSNEPGNASYYYSQTRLATEGTITVGDESFLVMGNSWKDHEYGTSSLSDRAVGWDWFSLQLSDGRELMYFQIRNEDGSLEPASSGSLILEDGTVRPLTLDEVQLEVLSRWQSAASGGDYPAAWRLRIPSEAIDLTIEPLIADQELRLSTTYWEGAVRVSGSAPGGAVSGYGYVELTGYAGERAPSV